MNHIGLKIKEFRKKQNMTQEKLAEYLNVSFQAVSKWETGQSSPDIGLLIPLSKALSVGVDELLGGDRRQEFEDRFQKSVCLGSKITLLVSEDALKEFPDDRTFLYRRACDEYFIGTGEDKAHENERIRFLKKAEAHFSQLCSKYPDDESYKSFLAKTYFALGKKQKAIDLAHKCKRKNELLPKFLEGEDKLRHKQSCINQQCRALYYMLLDYNTPDSLDIAGRLLDICYGEDRYVDELLWKLHTKLATNCLYEGDSVGFVNNLKIAYEAAMKHDRITKDEKVYTTPLFNLLSSPRAKDIELPSSVYQFMTDPILDKADFELKKRIVNDNISCRVLKHTDWRNYFKFCHERISTNTYFNFSIGWDMHADEVKNIGNRLCNAPCYPGNGPAEFLEINRDYVERLISDNVMSGCLAYFDLGFFGFCNCGDKNKYISIGISEDERAMATAPSGAKVFAIVEILVALNFKNCGIEEKLIDYALERAKKKGFTHAEVYPMERMYVDKADFDIAVKRYAHKGFKIIRDLSNKENGTHFIMQMKL